MDAFDSSFFSCVHNIFFFEEDANGRGRFDKKAHRSSFLFQSSLYCVFIDEEGRKKNPFEHHSLICLAKQ